MACFRVEMEYRRTKTFFVEAESKAEIIDFLESEEEWDPSDVDGLVDSDESEDESCALFEEEEITPVFALNGGELVMIDG